MVLADGNGKRKLELGGGISTLKDKTMLKAYLEAKVMSHVISESLASKPEFIRPGFHTCFCIYPQAKPRSLTGMYLDFLSFLALDATSILQLSTFFCGVSVSAKEI